MQQNLETTIQDTRPTFETQRLILRPFQLTDAKTVQRLAGNKEITSRTGTIPYPYPDGLAESWIERHPEGFAKQASLICAVTLKQTGEIIGCMALEGVSKNHKKGEIAYWMAIDHWGQGYCTEAAHTVVKFAFEQWQLNKITSRHKTTNPASGKVMQKLGMKYEGTLRQEMFKDGEFCDLAVYGLLKSEYPPKPAV